MDVASSAGDFGLVRSNVAMRPSVQLVPRPMKARLPSTARLYAFEHAVPAVTRVAGVTERSKALSVPCVAM